MALVSFATRYGPGVGGDATIYLTSARNFLAGQGLGWMDADGSFRLLPYSPPFYPLVLSAAGIFIQDMVAGARWINVILFGALVSVVGMTVYRFTRRSLLAGMLALAAACSPVLVGVAVWAMSEPVFLLTGFAGLILLLDHFHQPHPARLFGSAVLVGLALLARYIGLAFVVTAGLAYLVFHLVHGSRSGTSTWRSLILYGLVAILPILAWVIVDLITTGTVSSRSGQAAADYGRRFLEMGPALERIYLFWLLPESVVNRLAAVIKVGLWLFPLVGLAAAGGWVVSRRRVVSDLGIAPAAQLAAMMAAFIIIYLVLLAGVQVFTYPPVTLASRMLSPVHLAALVLVFTMSSILLSLLSVKGRLSLWVGLIIYGLVIGLAASYALRGVLVAREYHRSGIGYTAPAWRESQVIKAAQNLPSNIPLISNDVTALMFLANRPAYTLQEIFQDHPAENFTVYGSGNDESQRVFREEGGALVLFYASLSEDFQMYGDRSEQRIEALTQGLDLYFQGEDGAIYFYQPASR